MTYEKRYKYWFFYLHEKNHTELYAYTDDKECMKEFIQERDMTKFIMKKLWITTEEVSHLASSYNELYLVIMKGDTKIDSHGSNIVPFQLVMTKMEQLTIVNQTYSVIYNHIFLEAKYNPDLFNGEITKSLKTIMYSYCYNHYHGNDEIEYIDNDFRNDYLGAFISFYGNTMKKGK